MELSEIEIRFGELLRKPKKTQAEMSEKEELSILIERALTKDESPLIEDLLKVGLKVTSSWDLVNTESSYPEAIPVLIEHLQKPYHHKNKEGIVRALIVKEARGLAGKALIEKYYNTPNESLNIPWLIGCAMSVVITRKEIDSVIQIVKDKKNGISREGFVEALGKYKSEKSEQVLIELLDDEEMTLFALKALGRLKYHFSNSKIIKLLNHQDKEIQKAAKKALKSINKEEI